MASLWSGSFGDHTITDSGIIRGFSSLLFTQSFKPFWRSERILVISVMTERLLAESLWMGCVWDGEAQSHLSPGTTADPGKIT